MRLTKILLIAILIAVLMAGCSKPKPPPETPIHVEVPAEPKAAPTYPTNADGFIVPDSVLRARRIEIMREAGHIQ